MNVDRLFQLQDSATAERVARLGERGWFQRILDWLYGYDYFISYRWSDGRNYAVVLAEELKKQGFDCFLDSSDYIIGDNWKRVGERSLRKTSRLILVGSPQALRPIPPRESDEDPVVRELKIFTATGKRVIPVNFGGCLSAPENTDSPVLQYLDRHSLWIAESPARLLVGPSEPTLHGLRESFDRERQSDKRARFLRILITIFAALALVATMAATLAIISYQLAERRRAVAESRGRVADAQRLAAESKNALSLYPQRSLLLAVRAVQATSAKDPFVTEPEQSLRDAIAAVNGAPIGRWASISPDGKRVAIAQNNGEIHLESLGSPSESKIIARVPGLARVVHCDRWLAALTERGRCLLWDVQHPHLAPAAIDDVSQIVAITAAAVITEGRKPGVPRYRLWRLMPAQGGSLPAPQPVSEFNSYLPAMGERWIAVSRESGRFELWDLTDIASFRAVDLEDTQLIALSPDGRWALTDKYGYALVDLSAEPPMHIHLGVPQGWIAFAQFSPDSRYLSAVVADSAALSAALSVVQHPYFRLVFLWDLDQLSTSQSLTPQMVVDTHRSEVTHLFLSSSRLVSASTESIQVRSLNGADSTAIELNQAVAAGVLNVRILQGRWLVAQLSDHTIKVWDLVDQMQPPRELIGHDGPIASIGISWDERWLFSNRPGEASRRWSIASPPGDSLNVHRSRSPVGQIALDHGSTAYVGYANAGPAADGIAKLTITPEGLIPTRTEWRAQMLQSLKLSSCGRWLIWTSNDSAELHDLKSTDEAPIGVWRSISGTPSSCVASFSNDARWLVVNSETENSGLWSLPIGAGKPKETLLISSASKADQSLYRYIAIEPNGQWMIAVNRSGQVTCWDVSSKSPALKSGGFGKLPADATLEAICDNRWAVLKSDKALWLCNLSEPEVPAVRLPSADLPIELMGVSPDGRWGVMMSGAARVYQLLEVERGRVWMTELAVGAPKNRDSDVDRRPEVAFNPDGKSFAMWGVDEVVRLWRLEAAAKAEPIELRGHEQLVRHVLFMRGGRCLATGSDDGTVRLWDLDELGAGSVVLRGHRGPVSALAESWVPNRLLSGSVDGTVRVWHLWNLGSRNADRLQELIEAAIWRAGREPTAAEMKQFFRE